MNSSKTWTVWEILTAHVVCVIETVQNILIVKNLDLFVF